MFVEKLANLEKQTNSEEFKRRNRRINTKDSGYRQRERPSASMMKDSLKDSSRDSKESKTSQGGTSQNIS
jgi:hypothetical protein